LYALAFHLCASVCICGSISSAVRADSSPFGINGCSWSHLGMNTDKFDREAGLKRLQAIKEAGITWDRCDFWWGRIEPEQGKFAWRDVDWVVEQYVKHDVQLMPILCYGSAWQNSDAPVTDGQALQEIRARVGDLERAEHHAVLVAQAGREGVCQAPQGRI
jgi:hypothetical protein